MSGSKAMSPNTTGIPGKIHTLGRGQRRWFTCSSHPSQRMGNGASSTPSKKAVAGESPGSKGATLLWTSVQCHRTAPPGSWVSDFPCHQVGPMRILSVRVAVYRHAHISPRIGAPRLSGRDKTAPGGSPSIHQVSVYRRSRP